MEKKVYRMCLGCNLPLCQICKTVDWCSPKCQQAMLMKAQSSRTSKPANSASAILPTRSDYSNCSCMECAKSPELVASADDKFVCCGHLPAKLGGQNCFAASSMFASVTEKAAGANNDEYASFANSRPHSSLCRKRVSSLKALRELLFADSSSREQLPLCCKIAVRKRYPASDAKVYAGEVL